MDLVFTIGMRGRRLVDVIGLVPESVLDLPAVIGHDISSKTGLHGQIAPACRVLSLSQDLLDSHVL